MSVRDQLGAASQGCEGRSREWCPSPFAHLWEASVSLSLVLASLHGVSVVMSSTLRNDLGYYSLACAQGCIAVTAMSASSSVVSRITPKWAMFIGSLGYFVFMVSNFYPRAWLLIPASCLLGIGGALAWAGQGTYVAYAATSYSECKNKEPMESFGLFSGIFFGVENAFCVAGYVALSSILLVSPVKETSASSVEEANYTLSSTALYVFVSFFSFICGLGSFGLLLLPHEQPPVENVVPHNSLAQLIFSTLQLGTDTRMVLLVPLLFYCGIQKGFSSGVFTAKVISPNLGVPMIGFVFAVSSAATAICSAVFGQIGDVIGMKWIALFGFLADFSVYLSLTCLSVTNKVWSVPQQLLLPDWTIWVFSIALGIGDSLVYHVFSSTMVGRFTNKPAAYSNARFWMAAGTIFALVCGPNVTLGMMCAIVLAVTVVAVSCLFILDLLVMPINTKRKSQTPSDDYCATSTAVLFTKYHSEETGPHHNINTLNKRERAPLLE
ncbi:transporter, major facilitator subfamily protein [Pelomyxa schiedti]|nr:transporter, major facilitator subfamily protein [Pelomyxa schiedti]